MQKQADTLKNFVQNYETQQEEKLLNKKRVSDFERNEDKDIMKSAYVRSSSSSSSSSSSDDDS